MPDWEEREKDGFKDGEIEILVMKSGRRFRGRIELFQIKEGKISIELSSLTEYQEKSNAWEVSQITNFGFNIQDWQMSVTKQGELVLTMTLSGKDVIKAKISHPNIGSGSINVRQNKEDDSD